MLSFVNWRILLGIMVDSTRGAQMVHDIVGVVSPELYLIHFHVQKLAREIT